MARRKPKARHPRKCTAHSKRTGELCEGWAIKGGTVCRMHGGSASQVKQAGERNVALAEAERMLGRAGVDLDPLTHLVDSLHHASQLVAVYGLLVSPLDEAGELLTEGQRLHPFQVHFERAIERRARFAKLCVDAGVEQARVEIEERRAELVADVIRKVVDDPKLALSKKQRQTALQAAAALLRRLAGAA